MKHINWRSWLPAIGFAIALHVIFLGLFLSSKNNAQSNLNGNEDARSSVSSLTTLSSSSLHSQANSADLLTQGTAQTQTANLSDLNSVNNSNDNNSNVNNTDSTNAALMTQTIIVPKVASSTDNINQNRSQFNAINNTNGAVEGRINGANEARLMALDNEAIARVSGLESSAQTPQQSASTPDARPNSVSPVSDNNETNNAMNSSTSSSADSLLTARDLPQLQTNQLQTNRKEALSTVNNDALTEVVQTEAVNNQLSDLIDNVRLRNAQRIEQDQQRQNQVRITRDQGQVRVTTLPSRTITATQDLSLDRSNPSVNETPIQNVVTPSTSNRTAPRETTNNTNSNTNTNIDSAPDAPSSNPSATLNGDVPITPLKTTADTQSK